MCRINFIILVTINLFFLSQLRAQDSATKFIGKYLTKIKDIDSAVYEVKKKKNGKTETIANYFAEELTTFKVNGVDFLLYKFGAYADHIKPHFGIIRAGQLEENYVINCYNIEADFNKIFSFFKTFDVTPKELEKIKIKVMKHITRAYPE